MQRQVAQSSPRPAIVVGLCAHGLHIVRNLSRHGIPVIAVETDFGQPTAQTKYAEKVHCKDINGASLVDSLLEIHERHRVVLPVFLTNDKMLKSVLARWPLLEGRFAFPFERSLLEPLMDKDSLLDLARAHGFRLPRSFTLTDGAGLDTLPKDLSYPVILKPAMPMGSFKTEICESPTGVRSRVESCVGEPLLLQEWIPGDERHLFFCAYYIDSKLECRVQFSGRKLLCYPDVTGNTGAAEPVYYPRLLREGLEFFKALGFTGLCSIEYKGDPEAPYFIEVTVGRTDWWVMCATINGANLHVAAYNDLTQSAIPYSSDPTSKYVWHLSGRALPVIADKVRHGDWSVYEVLRYFARRKKYGLLDARDPKPFVLAMTSRLRELSGLSK